MIICKNIHLSFGSNVIFENFNVHILKGENVCINAKSGSGKTVLLKLLQAYIVPQKGDIIIGGIPLSKSTIKQIRNMIVWVPQNINLPVNNGMELIQMMELSVNNSLIVSNLQNLNLDETILSKNFSEISGGQKHRIIIAICLSIDRPIILLDEPTSAFDITTTNLLAKLIKSMGSKTVLSASHDTNWIKTTDRQIQLKNNKNDSRN